MKNNRNIRKGAKRKKRRAGNKIGQSAPDTDFRLRKLHLAMLIMGVGMLAALIWNAVQGWGLGHGYPRNTFLFTPQIRFSDLSDVTNASTLANPYVDPIAVYLPLAWLGFRQVDALPGWVNLIACFYVSLAVLFLLLVKALAPVVSGTWRVVFFSLLLLGTSYPVLFCLDRGNIEIMLVSFIGGSLYFLSQGRFIPALLCLILPISLKLYPALLLVLFVRQRKLAATVICLLVVCALTFFSLYWLSLPIQTAWNDYKADLAYYTNVDILENFSLESSSSPWNAYKCFLLLASHWGMIAPVDFSFDGEYIRDSYAVYTAGMILLVLLLAIHACFVEKEWPRCAMVLLLFLSIDNPGGGDYRLIYAGMALILHVLSKTRRAHDFLILVFLALTMVPMKQVLLTFLGTTESGYADVPIQVILDPPFVLTALFFILYDSLGFLDFAWSRQRLIRLCRLAPLRRPPEPDLSAAASRS